jgi:DNA helicase-2/ATP-dependent DNA helicase PcrA
MQYNKEQFEVLNFKDGACCVNAGAGSGKSTVLVQRVKELLHNGVNEEDICVVTFAENSSKDLRKKFNEEFINGVKLGTYHAICRGILTKEGIDTTKQLVDYQIEGVFKKIYEKVKFKEVKSFIGYQKNYGVGIDDEFVEKESEYSEELLRSFYIAYENLKKKNNALDFDDWLLIARDILKKNPNKYNYKYILIDEAQDNNIVQYEIAKLLCPSGNIMIIGDFRQAIYKFRGGEPELFMNFKDNTPNATMLNLTINYRSTKNIVDYSNNFIKKYYGNYKYYKDSIANNKKDGLIKKYSNFDKEEEAIKIVDDIQNKLKQGIKPNDIAVLYRLNQNSFNIENELKSRNIPYFISSTDGNFFNRKEINCIMCMLRLIDNPHDNVAYQNVFNTRMYPFTFLPNIIKDRIIEKSALNNISLFEASEQVKTDKGYQRDNLDIFIKMINKLIMQHKKGVKLPIIVDNIVNLLKIEESISNNNKYKDEEIEERIESLKAFKTFLRDNTLESFLKFVYGSNKSQKKCGKEDVQLMTIHKSKGLEFREVYIVGVEDGKFPNKKTSLDEESRLFYVGVTRAKENITISEIGYDNLFVNQYFENSNEVHNEQQIEQAS